MATNINKSKLSLVRDDLFSKFRYYLPSYYQRESVFSYLFIHINQSAFAYIFGHPLLGTLGTNNVSISERKTYKKWAVSCIPILQNN